jgi:UDP-N-acetylmuramate: L-alanyl-gamma-D-glutamyl-meso-diaminopimelate ligase
VPVFEGFGSSYEKARSAIDALRLHFSTRPLVVVFEPHTFGWRNRANLDWYDTAFEGASAVYVAPPETQGADTHDQLTHEEIMSRIRNTGMPAEALDPSQVNALADSLDPSSVVLVLTSGDLGGALRPLADAIAERFTAA